MPTYEYECQSCHRHTEAVQKFADPAMTTCDDCGGQLRKVFSAVGIVFKGSGFYKNDSRGTTPTAASATPASETSPATPTPTSTPTPSPSPSTATSSPSASSPGSSSSD